MSSNSIHILDSGRTLSLRFGNRAEEIVADTSEEATRALAKMLFEEEERAHLLESKLKDAHDRIAGMVERDY